MKGIFKGVYRNKGSFTDKSSGEYIEYDNAEFTVLVPFKATRNHIEGFGEEAADKMKCKYENFGVVCNTDDLDGGVTKFESLRDFEQFKNCRVRIERDQYGNLEELSFLEINDYGK